jgi:hypothetical protein
MRLLLKAYFLFLLMVIFLIPSIILSQEISNYTIEWLKSPETTHLQDQKLIQPNFINISLDGYRPIYYKTLEITSYSSFNYEIVDYDILPATEGDITFLSFYNIRVPSEVEFECKTVKDRSKIYESVSLFPFIRKDSKTYRISSFRLKKTIFKQSANKRISKSFLNNSVLSNGDWYKFSISKDGLYCFTYESLQNSGINIAGVPISQIHLFGNSFGSLPELNSMYRPDDLLQNSLSILNDSDGIFNKGDTLLFYGKGPDKLVLNGTSFKSSTNIYSDYSYYFLCVSDQFSLKQISSTSELFSFNNESESFNYFSVHEKEDTSLVSGGQRWYGELFDVNLSQSFDFFLPSNPIQNIDFSVSFASNAKQSGNVLQISSYGDILTSYSLSTVGQDYFRSEFYFSSSKKNINQNLEFNFKRVNPSTILFLDKIELNTRCSLGYSGSFFQFRDINSTGKGMQTKFNLSSSESNLILLDVTNPISPKRIPYTISQNSLTFNYPTDTLIEFAVGSYKNILYPTFISRISNQNLHKIVSADMLIVSPTQFLNEAEELAQIHRSEGLIVELVDVNKVYNEFSGGQLDPTAIKMFAKMIYDRSKNLSQNSLKSLLLFGDGTFDPKNRVAKNNNYIPTYQFLNSENHIDAMVSDDYYGMLDDNESINSADMLDIGVGRLLISSNQQARDQIDKIKQYLRLGLETDTVNCCFQDESSSFGDWRNKYVQITDDEEFGYFVKQDAEPQYSYVNSKYPALNCIKIYCDAFKQEVQAGGERYPEVYNKISSEIQKGVLLMNYTGHGGESGAAEERIITIPQINSWTNFSRLPLFVSSTCEFTKYDDPSRISAGEWMSINPKGGAIALMTTTRPVYFGVNTTTGSNFFKNVFEKDADSLPLTFGEIIRRTKNQSGANSNKRSFTLIGDPALRIARANYKIVIDSINGVALNNFADTIKALSKTKISAHIEDYNGKLLELDGVASTTIFDKKKEVHTLGQNVTSPSITFKTQENILFKGRSSLDKGYFKTEFVTPKDIDYNIGLGKISFYANSTTVDASGFDSLIKIGGINSLGLMDSIGPKINMYLNSKNFVNASITNSSPTLIVEIQDESGVNIVGNGIGHDLEAILDNQTEKSINLNDYYISDLNSYKSGKVVYKFKDLSEGRHSLKVKVWDVNNNPSDQEIIFTVAQENTLTLSHVLNYPNPFTTETEFYFEHNQICDKLDVQIQIYTISGKLVQTLTKSVNQQGFRSEGIVWDGKDSFGDKLAKGVYIYQVLVKNSLNEIARKTEKLVLF